MSCQCCLPFSRQEWGPLGGGDGCAGRPSWTTGQGRRCWQDRLPSELVGVWKFQEWQTCLVAPCDPAAWNWSHSFLPLAAEKANEGSGASVWTVRTSRPTRPRRGVSVVSCSLHQRSHCFQKHSFPFDNSWQTLWKNFIFCFYMLAYFYPQSFTELEEVSCKEGRERKVIFGTFLTLGMVHCIHCFTFHDLSSSFVRF